MTPAEREAYLLRRSERAMKRLLSLSRKRPTNRDRVQAAKWAAAWAAKMTSQRAINNLPEGLAEQVGEHLGYLDHLSYLRACKSHDVEPLEGVELSMALAMLNGQWLPYRHPISGPQARHISNGEEFPLGVAIMKGLQ